MRVGLVGVGERVGKGVQVAVIVGEIVMDWVGDGVRVNVGREACLRATTATNKPVQ